MFQGNILIEIQVSSFLMLTNPGLLQRSGGWPLRTTVCLILHLRSFEICIIFWDLYHFLRSVSFFEIWIIFWDLIHFLRSGFFLDLIHFLRSGFFLDLIHFLRSGFFWDLNNFLRSGLFFEICICFWDPKRTKFGLTRYLWHSPLGKKPSPRCMQMGCKRVVTSQIS